MKYRQLPVVIFILVIAFITSTGCEGPAGPQGEIGPQGPQGSSGVQGVAGEDGEDGTANVIYSEWINFELDNWSGSLTFFGQTRREYPIEELAIDSEIIEKGTVMVYARFGGTNARIQPLPIIGPITSTSRDQVLNFHIRLENIFIEFFNLVDRDLDPGRFGSSNQYRYIIIPGGVPAKAIGDYPDMNDYYAVMEYFGIDP